MKTTDFNKTVMKRIAKRVKGQGFDNEGYQEATNVVWEDLTIAFAETLNRSNLSPEYIYELLEEIKEKSVEFFLDVDSVLDSPD